jgi:hypothetical protein
MKKSPGLIAEFGSYSIRVAVSWSKMISSVKRSIHDGFLW